MGSLAVPKTTLPIPYRQTHLLPSPTLSTSAKCQIYLKLENLQPSGSFKSRGIGNLIHHHALLAQQQQSQSPRPLHFYSSSGGNAGLAAVHAATSLLHPCTVVVPTSTEASIIAKLHSSGASDVVVHGDSWFHADAYMRDTVMAAATSRGETAIYVPPFDHQLVWDGASTIIDEIATQLPDGEAPDAIICSVGGGGLFCGLMQGIHAHGWQTHTRVVAVETLGAESLNDSLRAGHLVTRKSITSVAKSLGALRVSAKTFEYAQQPNVRSVVLSDAEACMACWRFVDDERMLVEPACGAAAALAYLPEKLREVLPDLRADSKVVVIVCGGSRISIKDLDEYRERFGEEVSHLEVTQNGDVPSTHTVP